jgi:Thioredoxin-like
MRNAKAIMRGDRSDYSLIVLRCCSVFLVWTIGGIVVLHSRCHFGGSNSVESSLHGFFLQRSIQELHPPSDSSLPLPPLSQFKSLEYPFAHSKLVGLYFAASYCGMSSDVTQMLDEYFGDDLLLAPPPPKSGTADGGLPPTSRDEMPSPPLSITYVSSDKNEEEFQQYLRKNWFPVPFQSSERTDLKRHFSVCSYDEVKGLGINRTFEIPTLIIFDGATREVLTMNGPDDLEKYGNKTLDHWMALHDLARVMERKYAATK